MSEWEYAVKSHAEHKAIYEALAARDAEDACHKMEHHIIRSMEDELTHYSSDEK